ncbi:MAG: 2-amino-4-hydroxy-6-hydroxymethyldihydropteridine diphosphokinase [Thermodesulfobacteriota bacterium]
MLTYIGIGSNLGDSLANCRQAIQAIGAEKGNKIVACSSFYITEPVGRKDQNWFVNAVIAVETNFSPRQLIEFLMNIEENMGRKRKERWGPRVIDLDILFYENLICQEDNLQIPHPEMVKRRFVLQPLKDIAPHLVHPKLGKTVSELLDELPPAEKVIPLLEKEQCSV